MQYQYFTKSRSSGNILPSCRVGEEGGYLFKSEKFQVRENLVACSLWNNLPTRTYHTKARSDGIPKRRYEKKRPNQQWHIDFAETKLQDGTRVVIIALIDDYSRYCLRCEVVSDMTTETAIQTVQAAWQEFGLPAEIVSDNGRAFTSVYEDTPTDFGQVLQQKGICHRLITPYWPEGNSKAEAFIKIVKRECLKHPFATLEELQRALAEFVVFYNHFRLHGGLGYQTPVSRFLGVESFKDHGLSGIPGLPKSLVNVIKLVEQDPKGFQKHLRKP